MKLSKNSVRLLVVEDNPGFLAELITWLTESGFTNIETATSAHEAINKLRPTVDIIIADMRMESEDSGFTVVEEVKRLNLSSVVLILTANDNVADCRTAFKMGAWDYVSKNMRGNVFDVLIDSIDAAISYFNRWGNEQDKQWISEHTEELLNQYYGQYIAVANKVVIDAANTEELLWEKIDQRQLRRFLITIQRIGGIRPTCELLDQPEGEHIEYKSSFQWDVRHQSKNPDLKFSALKTIAAFLNSNGGTLLIGVDDNGKVLGLQQDILLLSNGNTDKFERVLVDSIANHIGSGFIQYIKIVFDQIDGVCICAIHVRKSAQKAWLQRAKGEKLEFYVRMQNSSRPLDIPALYVHISGSQ